jgi:hypothetical protein
MVMLRKDDLAATLRDLRELRDHAVCLEKHRLGCGCSVPALTSTPSTVLGDVVGLLEILERETQEVADAPVPR